MLLFALCWLTVTAVTFRGQTFVSPWTSVSISINVNLSQVFPLRQETFSDLCSGRVMLPRNLTAGAVLYVKHTKGDSLLCQMWRVCEIAQNAGFVAVLDGFLEPKPVGVAAAVSYLNPVASCNLTYLAVEFNSSDPAIPVTDDRFDMVVAPFFEANPFNVSVLLGPQSMVFNAWFQECRLFGSFYQGKRRRTDLSLIDINETMPLSIIPHVVVFWWQEVDCGVEWWFDLVFFSGCCLLLLLCD